MDYTNIVFYWYPTIPLKTHFPIAIQNATMNFTSNNLYLYGGRSILENS